MSDDPLIDQAEDATDSQAQERFADLFDVRRIIAALFGVYGLILFVLGLFASDEDIERAQGFNVNLWVGLALLASAAIFMLWALRSPVGAELVARDDEPKAQGGSAAP